MAELRVKSPDLSVKQTGPASYFPSIEKNYGKPIQYWLELAAEQLDTKKHGEVVTWLKEQYGLGHGHANAIVGYAKVNLLP